MAYLEVKDVTVEFPILSGMFKRQTGTFKAVDRVSFSLEQGEIMALIGQSGSGKSTLANVILGLLDPTAGTVTLNGEDVSQYKFQGKVQAVFQNPYSSLNPRMNILNIVSEPYRHIHPRATKAEIEARTRETLAKVGISEPDSIHRFPHEFSGGQRQRISIARALICDPEIIILDEPVSSLDVSIRAQILNLLAQLKNELRLSYIYISHDLATVRFLSQRLMIIKDGRMMEYGNTKKIYASPRSPYTQLLLRSARDIIIDEDIESLEKNIKSGPDYPRATEVEVDHVVYCT